MCIHTKRETMIETNSMEQRKLDRCTKNRRNSETKRECNITLFISRKASLVDILGLHFNSNGQ